ncbi:MerR family DNA-binding transcriptional regulator [uncultured Endozoicomonas sp.]|uniref:MerR family transcriptional regulator n=1 Tax=uncultured Endozoicomonas sp. TaxID=432652 RepID=UPI00261E6A26|nr:MerR family DNA-binding transcriptional regulator [uncultured Endozoicomonas sp.]
MKNKNDKLVKNNLLTEAVKTNDTVQAVKPPSNFLYSPPLQMCNKKEEMPREEIMNQALLGVGYIKIKEFATLAGISESTLRRYERKGFIPERENYSVKMRGWPANSVLPMIEGLGSQFNG